MFKRLFNLKNNTPEISVIIPVYNVEKYLGDCLESAVNQTFKNIEIICVNDGSTDNSLNILNSYAKTDERIRIITQKNKGVSNARNVGLDASKGKYIYFMDADDFLELNALDELHSLIKEKSCDLVIFKTLNFIDETGEYVNIDYYDMAELTSILGNKTFNYSDYVNELIGMDVTVYTKFFKRKIISNIRFAEGLIFEDNLFTMELIFNTKSIYFHNKYLYHRRMRENSLMNSSGEMFMNSLEILNRLEELFKRKGYYEDNKETLFIKKYASLNNRLNLIDESYKEELFNRIKSDLNAKQNEYDKAINFDEIDPALRDVYERLCNSNTYEEFKK